jgi:rubrerythrin
MMTNDAVKALVKTLDALQEYAENAVESAITCAAHGDEDGVQFYSGRADAYRRARELVVANLGGA